MRTICKLISVSLVSLLFSFSLANASSGVFKLSHDLGFGKDTNLDAISKGRLFQVVIDPAAAAAAASATGGVHMRRYASFGFLVQSISACHQLACLDFGREETRRRRFWRGRKKKVKRENVLERTRTERKKGSGSRTGTIQNTRESRIDSS